MQGNKDKDSAMLEHKKLSISQVFLLSQRVYIDVFWGEFVLPHEIMLTETIIAVQNCQETRHKVSHWKYIINESSTGSFC